MGQEASKPIERHTSNKSLALHSRPLQPTQAIKIELKPQINRRASIHQTTPKKAEICLKANTLTKELTSSAKIAQMNDISAIKLVDRKRTEQAIHISDISYISGKSHSTQQKKQSKQQLEVKRQPTLTHIKDMKKRSNESDKIIYRDTTQSFQTTKTPDNIYSSQRSSVTRFQLNKISSLDSSQMIENQYSTQNESDMIYQCYVRHQQQRKNSIQKENSIYQRTNYKNNSFISQASEISQCNLSPPLTQVLIQWFIYQKQNPKKVNNQSPIYLSQNPSERCLRANKNYASEHTSHQKWQHKEQTQIQQHGVGHSFSQSDLNQENYAKLPYLQFQNGFNVLTQINQLNQEKKDLIGMTEQQKLIINQQYQLLVQLTQLQNYTHNAGITDKPSPIIINNNILSPEVYKRDTSNQENRPPSKQEEVHQILNKILDTKPSDHEDLKSTFSLHEIQLTQKTLPLYELKNKTPVKSSHKKVLHSQKASPISNQPQTQTPLKSESKSFLIQKSEQKSFLIQKSDDQIRKEPTITKKAIKLDFNFDSEKKESNLADCFKARKKTLIHVNETKIELKIEARNDNVQKSLSVNIVKKKVDEEVEKRDEWVVNVNRRSKEEQIKLRKEMMNYGKSVRQNHRASQEEVVEVKALQQFRKESPVLERLALGGKVKVPEKEMYALTKKNYENLPEVKQKRSNAQTKLERNDFLQDRKSKVKDLEKETRNRLFKKKDIE